MAKLHFTLGENLGEILFQTAQEHILQGDIDKAFSLYKILLHGFTDEYVMKVLKNEMVLVTDDSGEEMNLTNDPEEISSNKEHIYDWKDSMKEMSNAFKWLSDDDNSFKDEPPYVQEGIDLFAKYFRDLWG